MDALMQDPQNKVTAFRSIEKGDQLPIQSNNNNNFWIRSSAKMHHNIWSIGTPSDYDTLWNVTNWKWHNIVPYFTQTEKVIIDEVVHEFGTIIPNESKPKSRSYTIIEKAFSTLPLGPARDSFTDKYFSYGNRDITRNRGTD
eukprot:355655_1